MEVKELGNCVYYTDPKQFFLPKVSFHRSLTSPLPDPGGGGGTNYQGGANRHHGVQFVLNKNRRKE